jgi:hypothetical protein
MDGLDVAADVATSRLAEDSIGRSVQWVVFEPNA